MPVLLGLLAPLQAWNRRSSCGRPLGRRDRDGADGRCNPGAGVLPLRAEQRPALAGRGRALSDALDDRADRAGGLSARRVRRHRHAGAAAAARGRVRCCRWCCWPSRWRCWSTGSNLATGTRCRAACSNPHRCGCPSRCNSPCRSRHRQFADTVHQGGCRAVDQLRLDADAAGADVRLAFRRLRADDAGQYRADAARAGRSCWAGRSV